jgi:hypothetical protein
MFNIEKSKNFLLSENKIILNECFLDIQLIELFNETNIYSILMKDLKFPKEWKISKEDLAEEFTHIGGAMGFDGIYNWNNIDLKSYFFKLYNLGDLTKESYLDILDEIDKIDLCVSDENIERWGNHYKKKPESKSYADDIILGFRQDYEKMKNKL